MVVGVGAQKKQQGRGAPLEMRVAEVPAARTICPPFPGRSSMLCTCKHASSLASGPTHHHHVISVAAAPPGLGSCSTPADCGISIMAVHTDARLVTRLAASCSSTAHMCIACSTQHFEVENGCQQGLSLEGPTCVPAGMAASGSVLPTAMGASGPARSTAPAAMRCGAST
jgi:hypothetical protein